MIVRLTAKNQRKLFDDDQRRLRAKQEMHYSIGQHLSLLIDRMDALEAQGIEARRDAIGTSAVHESPVGNADAPETHP